MRIDDMVNFLGTHGGPAKPDRFRAEILAPTSITSSFTDGQNLGRNLERLTLACDQAVLPSYALSTSDQRIYGSGYKLPYNKLYEDIPLTFLCTNDGLFERRFFNHWLEYIMPENNGSDFRFPKGNRGGGGYYGTLRVHHYRPDSDDPIYSVEFVDAFPMNIQTQPLDWSLRDETFKLQVTFAFYIWRELPLGRTSYR